jgi:ABC-type bacteriocin/lantibiotic exporters, contain an N-terminal double-glycine peptidase domain
MYNIGRDGMSVGDICDVFQQIHIQAKLVKVDGLSNINQFPCILCLRHHFVVLEKRKNEIYKILDPARGNIKLSKCELENEFAGYVITATPMKEFKIEKTKQSEYVHVFEIVKEVKMHLFIGMVTSILCSLVTLYFPMLIQNIINQIVYEQGNLDVKYILLKVAVIIAIYLIMMRLRNDRMVSLQVKIVQTVATKTFYHAINIPYVYYDNRNSGDVLFRMDLVENMQNTLSAMFVTITIGAVAMLVTLGYICYNYIYVLPILIIIMAFIILYIIIVNRKLLVNNKRMLSKKEKTKSYQTESLINIFQIKSSRMEHKLMEQYKAMLNDYCKEYKESIDKFDLELLFTDVSKLRINSPSFRSKLISEREVNQYFVEAQYISSYLIPN